MRNQLGMLGFLVLSSCAPNPNAANVSVEDNILMANMDAAVDAGASASKPEPAPSDATAWTYDEKKDEMRGAVRKIASVSAVEPITLPFPYGESTPTLNVRKDPKFGFDIYVSANGQFLCRSYDNDTVSVKFDDGPIKNWACADADGGSSDVVFITRGQAFLSELRKAKRVTIEAQMYEAGRQQMTFAVSGLKWP